MTLTDRTIQNLKTTDKVSAAAAANSFEVVAREWHSKQKTKKNPSKAKDSWTERYAAQVIARLEKNAFPTSASIPSTASKRRTC